MPNPKVFDVMVKQLSTQMDRGGFLLNELPKTLRTVLGENEWQASMWRERVDKDTGEIYKFDKFEDFIAAPPTAGLGASMKVLKEICREDPVALDMIDQAVQMPHGGSRVKVLNQQLDHDEEAKQDGSSRHLRRLRKDRPDLHEKVLAGEMTITAAVVDAGFYPKRVSIRLDDVASAIATIERNASPEFIAEMKKQWQERG